MDNNELKNLIYEIRGKQIMFDSDLAKLYDCANGAKTINQAVNRNQDRFPQDFYFQLTDEEYQELKLQNTPNILRSQIGTSKVAKRGGRQYKPYVFTEQGVAMLASVLRTTKASEMSINKCAPL